MTTNLKNGKIYVGQHQTENLDDGYLGSGLLLNKAIEKYGIENFKREIICFCNSKDEMNQKEKEIVNEEFVKRKDTYNMVVGGYGGASTGMLGAIALKEHLKNDDEFRKEYKRKAKDNYLKVKDKLLEGNKKYIKEHGSIWFGKKHTEETKQKIGKANSIAQKGEKNSHFGRVWIHNIELRETISVKKEELQNYLDKGYKLGRVCNWDSYLLGDEFKYKTPKRIKQYLRTKKIKEENKEYYNELFEIYKDGGYKKVVKEKNYKYTHQNLRNQFRRYVKNFDEFMKEKKKKKKV